MNLYDLNGGLTNQMTADVYLYMLNTRPRLRKMELGNKFNQKTHAK